LNQLLNKELIAYQDAFVLYYLIWATIGPYLLLEHSRRLPVIGLLYASTTEFL